MGATGWRGCFRAVVGHVVGPGHGGCGSGSCGWTGSSGWPHEADREGDTETGIAKYGPPAGAPSPPPPRSPLRSPPRSRTQSLTVITAIVVLSSENAEDDDDDDAGSIVITATIVTTAVIAMSSENAEDDDEEGMKGTDFEAFLSRSVSDEMRPEYIWNKYKLIAPSSSKKMVWDLYVGRLVGT